MGNSVRVRKADSVAYFERATLADAKRMQSTTPSACAEVNGGGGQPDQRAPVIRRWWNTFR